MGAAAVAAVVGVLVGLGGQARAQSSCVGVTADGARYPICFDPGNRLYLELGGATAGGSTALSSRAGVVLRHTLEFADEPDLSWKLEHHLAGVEHTADRARVALYRGRFLRHARDGHLVLPFAVTRKIFLPFDIGAEASAGTLEVDGERIQLDVIDAAALIDLGRSAGFGRRLALGPQVRWSVVGERRAARIGEHRVAPLSGAVFDAGAESPSGVYRGRLRLEAGRQWSSAIGWHTRFAALVDLERLMLAVNDRPLSLRIGADVRSRPEGDCDARAEIGLRLGLFQRARRTQVAAARK